jgi:hypothetical protein
MSGTGRTRLEDTLRARIAVAAEDVALAAEAMAATVDEDIAEDMADEDMAALAEAAERMAAEMWRSVAEMGEMRLEMEQRGQDPARALSPTETVEATERRVVGPGDETCSVCLGAFEAGQETLSLKRCSCHRAFHVDCLTQWLGGKGTCPLCRGLAREQRPQE